MSSITLSRYFAMRFLVSVIGMFLGVFVLVAFVDYIDTMRKDISPREVAVVAPLIALILLLGFYPKPVLDVINPAVKATLSQVGKSDPSPAVQANAHGGGK